MVLGAWCFNAYMPMGAYQANALVLVHRSLLLLRSGGSHWSRLASGTTQVRRRLHEIMLVTMSHARGGGRASHAR